MSKIDNIEIFFLEYSFPKSKNYQYSGGVVENMIVGVIRIIDTEGEYGLGEVTHAQFTHKPIIGLVEHFKSLLVGILMPKESFASFITQSLLLLSFLIATFLPVIILKIKNN